MKAYHSVGTIHWRGIDRNGRDRVGIHHGLSPVQVMQQRFDQKFRELSVCLVNSKGTKILVGGIKTINRQRITWLKPDITKPETHTLQQANPEFTFRQNPKVR